jgi:hypothetical protein
MLGSGKARMLARVGALRGSGAPAAALHSASVLTIEGLRPLLHPVSCSTVHSSAILCRAFSDLIGEETSIEKARSVFSDMVDIPAVQQAVDRLCRTSQMASDEGRDPSSMMDSMHMVFYGPAGVGKSETARRFGRVLYNLRVLVSGLRGTCQSSI